MPHTDENKLTPTQVAEALWECLSIDWRYENGGGQVQGTIYADHVKRMCDSMGWEYPDGMLAAMRAGEWFWCPRCKRNVPEGDTENTPALKSPHQRRHWAPETPGGRDKCLSVVEEGKTFFRLARVTIRHAMPETAPWDKRHHNGKQYYGTVIVDNNRIGGGKRWRRETGWAVRDDAAKFYPTLRGARSALRRVAYGFDYSYEIETVAPSGEVIDFERYVIKLGSGEFLRAEDL